MFMICLKRGEIMDNLNLFNNKAENYVKARPSYAKMLIEKLKTYNLGNESTVADIGCGTGIFARQLLEIGAKVYGVEINDEMRSKAEVNLAAFSDFISVNACAEDTTLADESVDFITCAQSFHWFDKKKFKVECKRILKDGGYVALVWNSRDNDAQSVKELSDLTKKYCKNFVGFNGGTRKDIEEIKEFFDGKYEYFEFDNPLEYDEEKFVERCLSSSYALVKDDENYALYVEECKSFFAKYQKNGTYEMPNKSELYIGKTKND